MDPLTAILGSSAANIFGQPYLGSQLQNAQSSQGGNAAANYDCGLGLQNAIPRYLLRAPIPRAGYRGSKYEAKHPEGQKFGKR
jgi:hypothetical protein